MTELEIKLAEALRDCRKSLVAIIDGEGGIGLEAPEVIDATEALRLYDAATALPVQDLPPLPIEWRKVEDADGVEVPVFRAFQMRDYARAALAATPAPARCANGPIGCDYPRCDCNGASTKESNQ